MRRVLIILIACLPVLAAAACPPPPPGFTLPTAQRSKVDLIGELDERWQAGGEVVVVCGPHGWPQVGRLQAEPRDSNEEMARRREAWKLVRLLNLARRPGQVKPDSLAITVNQEGLLERFALSDAGAVWMREVVDDTLRLFNRGDLDARRKVWDRALRSGKMPRLAELLTGRLTEGGEFSSADRLFMIYAYHGEGAQAEPGIIGLGDGGFQCVFPASNQLVDPHAILSHEFGHTRYGDPTSAGSLAGEAATVELYENPVRERNGYEPRTVYYVRQSDGALKAGDSGLLKRLIKLQTVEGISVEDRTAIEQIHCQCPAPLPLILDCQVRQRPAGEWTDLDGLPLGPDMDCKVNWQVKPAQQP